MKYKESFPSCNALTNLGLSGMLVPRIDVAWHLTSKIGGVPMKKNSLGYLVIFSCLIGLVVGLVLIAVGPSPVTQVKSMQAIQQPVPGTELRVAYGKEGPAEPHIVRITSDHQLVADLGKVSP